MKRKIIRKGAVLLALLLLAGCASRAELGQEYWRLKADPDKAISYLNRRLVFNRSFTQAYLERGQEFRGHHTYPLSILPFQKQSRPDSLPAGAVPPQ